jgi:hypothetical protein
LYPVGIIAAVNESVWEHFKLGVWPALIYGLIEIPVINKYAPNFIIAKTAGIYLIPITIAVIHYLYTSIIHESSLAVDILSFVLAVIACQIASYKIITQKPMVSRLSVISVALLGCLLLAFTVFTFYPPHLPLFLDGPTGTYGIFASP